MKNNYQLLDIVIPVKPSLTAFVREYTIPGILQFVPFRKIVLLVNKSSLKDLKFLDNSSIELIDEDELIDGLNKNAIKNILADRGASKDRAGWYFQQFLKLGIAQTELVGENYLVWDADCIPLQPIPSFFKGEKTLFDTTPEYHAPYFETSKRLLDVQRQVDFSFISEHLVFNKKIVQEILSLIARKDSSRWWEIILDHVDDNDLSKSGFSEYEFYGNYLYKHHPDIVHIRKLKKSRSGTKLLGKNPSNRGLKILALSNHYVSFEEWHTKIKSPFKRYLKLLKSVIKGIG